jgi:hypothetical protein
LRRALIQGRIAIVHIHGSYLRRLSFSGLFFQIVRDKLTLDLTGFKYVLYFCLVPEPPPVPDRFITLILHNKLGRAARVVPSKGKHKNRGYVVGPRSFVKVSIIIKGEKYVEPITFRGEDLETQSKLLLNKALFPISLTPSNLPDANTNLSISAEGRVPLYQSFIFVLMQQNK